MIDFFAQFFDSKFMPHGHCFFWDPWILWSNVLADALIAVSYFSIPIALLYFVKKRTDLAFQWIFLLFAIFILACGTTHLLEIWNIWHGNYATAAVVKIITAIASIATAILLWQLIPHALEIPSRKALDESNASLSKEVKARSLAQQEVINLNRQLESRILKVNQDQQIIWEDFRMLADYIPQLVWIMGADDRAEYVNARWLEYTGISQEDVTQGKWQNIVHPEDLNQCLERWNESLKTGQPYKVEYRLKGVDGEYRSFLGLAHPLRDINGKVVRWLGTCTPITHDSNKQFSFQSSKE